MARGVLCSPHAATRAGLRKVLEAQNVEVCAEVDEASRALEAVGDHKPDCCLLDTVAGDVSVAVAAIATRAPRTAVVLLADSPTEAEFLRALHVGASGYLPKDMDMDLLVEAVIDACAGVPAIPRQFMAAIVEAFRARGRASDLPPGVQGKLSRRECEVLEHLRMGEPTAAIALRLSVSPVTVRRHRSSILEKLGAPNRQAALELIPEAATADDARGQSFTVNPSRARGDVTHPSSSSTPARDVCGPEIRPEVGEPCSRVRVETSHLGCADTES